MRSVLLLLLTTLSSKHKNEKKKKQTGKKKNKPNQMCRELRVFHLLPMSAPNMAQGCVFWLQL